MKFYATDQHYQVIADWFKTNLMLQSPSLIDRAFIANLASTPPSIIDLSIAALIQNDFLENVNNTRPGNYILKGNWEYITGAFLRKMCKAYMKKAVEASKRKRQKLAYTPVDKPQPIAGPIAINFDKAEPVKTTQRLNQPVNDNRQRVYGYYTPTGPVWFNTSADAADSAVQACAKLGYSGLDIVMKIGEVVNKPTVSLFG